MVCSCYSGYRKLTVLFPILQMRAPRLRGLSAHPGPQAGWVRLGPGLGVDLVVGVRLTGEPAHLRGQEVGLGAPRGPGLASGGWPASQPFPRGRLALWFCSRDVSVSAPVTAPRPCSTGTPGSRPN